MQTYDMIVIGGGLVGGAIAWGAARLGARVAMLDDGDVAHRAARGNFGLVWVQSKGAGMPPYAHWTRRSAELWPELASSLAASTGIDVALNQKGGLKFCLTEGELDAAAALIERMHNESGGIGTRMLDRHEIKALVPAIGDRVLGASFCPMDGHADPLRTLRALQAALLAAGGGYFSGCRVETIAPGFTVIAGSERFAAPKLVIAAGLGGAPLAPLVALSLPVRPLRGQIVVTERIRPFLDYATHVVRQTAEGSVMLGDSHEEVGFDNGTTPGVMQKIAARAVTMFPCLAAANVVRVWGALRVMTSDGLPIYQQSPRYPGAFAATCHSGVTLAAAHALALAPAILEGTLPADLAPFDSARFDVPAA